MLHLFVLVFLVACEAITLPPGCMNNANTPVNCTIETGGADVECPKENVIRVIGDYRNFSIHCQSYDPLEFTYNGTKPTEAIRINKWVDVTFGNDSNRDPKVIRQHIKVEGLSVVSLIEEYKKTQEIESSNLSIAPAIYYSRSGGFSFNAISTTGSDYSLNFVIFFEEPKGYPGFINRYERNQGFRLRTRSKYTIGCSSTHYVQPDGWGEPELWINGGRTTAKYEYDPTVGFTVFSSFMRIPSGAKFQCVIPHKTNTSKHVVFDPTLTTSAYELSLKKLNLEATRSDLWGFFSHGGNFQARCNPENSTLYFIGARNPEEQVLVRDFVLPDLADRSLYVERGRPSEDKSQFLPGVQTHRGTSLHFGALYCQGLTQYNLRSFVTDIRGQSSFLGLKHSIDWRKIQGNDRDKSWPEAFVPSQADPGLYLELKNPNEGRTVYDTENLTFHCRAHPFLLRPVVWEIEQNGTVTRQVENDETKDPPLMTTRLNAGFASISCLAALRSWRDKWPRLSTNVTVLDAVHVWRLAIFTN